MISVALIVTILLVAGCGRTTTLAVLETGEGSTHLWVSTDQMQTWHELPQAPYGPPGHPLINPATGDLLVLGNNQPYIYEWPALMCR